MVLWILETSPLFSYRSYCKALIEHFSRLLFDFYLFLVFLRLIKKCVLSFLLSPKSIFMYHNINLELVWTLLFLLLHNLNLLLLKSYVNDDVHVIILGPQIFYMF